MRDRALRYPSPLRYPGGKGRLAGFIKSVFERNGLTDGHYVEPYAGGASIALSLLFSEHASHVHINDLDRSVYAFWYSVLRHTDELCELILNVPLTMWEWRKQRAIQLRKRTVPRLALGFSTFYLNRTNRSGIVTGGPIGGTEQKGKWKLDARFNREELVRRIQRVAAYRERITLTRLDAAKLLRDVVPGLPKQSLLYLDPPYFIKGEQRLYANFYRRSDHADVSRLVAGTKRPWIVSYDDAPEIRALYRPFKRMQYGLRYSAADRYDGEEVMFFAAGLDVSRLRRHIAP